MYQNINNPILDSRQLAMYEFQGFRQDVIKNKSYALPCTRTQSLLREKSEDYRLDADFLKAGELSSDLKALEGKHSHLRGIYRRNASKYVLKYSGLRLLFEEFIGRLEFKTAQGELEMWNEYMDQVFPQELVKEYNGLKRNAEIYLTELDDARKDWFHSAVDFHQEFGFEAVPPENLQIKAVRFKAQQQWITPLLEGNIIPKCREWLHCVWEMEKSRKSKQMSVKNEKLKYQRMIVFSCLAIGNSGLMCMFHDVQLKWPVLGFFLGRVIYKTLFEIYSKPKETLI